MTSPDLDILGLWFADVLLPVAFVVAGVVFTFGFCLVVIRTTRLSALFRREE
jgi:formate/nitrite transporter FocA (FNT family)